MSLFSKQKRIGIRPKLGYSDKTLDSRLIEIIWNITTIVIAHYQTFR